MKNFSQNKIPNEKRKRFENKFPRCRDEKREEKIKSKYAKRRSPAEELNHNISDLQIFVEKMLEKKLKANARNVLHTHQLSTSH